MKLLNKGKGFAFATFSGYSREHATRSVSVRSQRVFMWCQWLIPTLGLQLWLLGKSPSHFAERFCGKKGRLNPRNEVVNSCGSFPPPPKKKIMTNHLTSYSNSSAWKHTLNSHAAVVEHGQSNRVSSMVGFQVLHCD